MVGHDNAIIDETSGGKKNSIYIDKTLIHHRDKFDVCCYQLINRLLPKLSS